MVHFCGGTLTIGAYFLSTVTIVTFNFNWLQLIEVNDNYLKISNLRKIISYKLLTNRGRQTRF